MRRQPDNWRKWAMWLGWLICLEHSWTSLCQILRLLFWKDGWMVVVGWGWVMVDGCYIGCKSFDLERHGSSVAKLFFFWNKMNHFTFVHRDINLSSYTGHSQVQLLLILIFNLYQPISFYIPYIPYWIDEWMWHVQQKIFNRGLWHFMTQYPVRSGIMLMTHHFKWLVKMGWFMKSGLPH